MNENDTDSMRLGRIAATIPVADMARACAFYVDVLGFAKVFENGDPVGFVILRRDEAELHLTLQPGHRPARFNVAHMIAHDADRVHAACQRAGVRIVKRIQDKDFGMRAFVFEDTEGNRIDVGQPL